MRLHARAVLLLEILLKLAIERLGPDLETTSVDLAVELLTPQLSPTASLTVNTNLTLTICPSNLRLVLRWNLHHFDNMAGDHRNAHRPADQVGEVSMNSQLALEKRLTDLKQLLKTDLVLSSTEAAHVEAYEVRVSIIAGERVPISFPGCLPKSSTIRYIRGTPQSQQPHRRYMGSSERRFDPLLYLGNDVMHRVLLFAVSLWDVAEGRARETEIIPKHYMGDPLMLVNVSRRWRQFVTSSPQLWSYVLIDTDTDDVLEYLQLFLHLSRNTKLFVVLHGSAALCDTIFVDLLRVGDRIGALVYPPNISRSTLVSFRIYLGASHDQPEHACRWYELEVQSAMQPQQCLNHYSFPTSIQSLWMGGPFPLSRLVTLSHFQSLSFLSVRFSLDMVLPPAHVYRLELPKLEVLRVQMALASHHQVDTPSINMICRSLKLLHLRYALELDVEDPQEDPTTWVKFDGVDSLEELQIDLAIHGADSVQPLDWSLQDQLYELHKLQGLQERLQSEERQLVAERLEMERLQERLLLERNNEPRGGFWTCWEVRPWGGVRTLKQPSMRMINLVLMKWDLWSQHLRFMISLYMRWRTWLNLPNSLTLVQQSSLKVTLSARMHRETFRVIQNMIEEILVWRLPQLTELTTSKVFPIFPKHLRKLRLHGFAVSDSLPSITLPSLVSLEIIADSPDHLVMGQIQVPRLRVLQVQVKDGPGMLHNHDWGDTTNNLLDHISLRIKTPRGKRGNHILAFHLPQTQSLNIFSPSRPLHLYLSKPAPLFYTLNTGLGTMSGPSHDQVGSISAMWNERLVTEWINPRRTPSLAKFKTLISLQRIVLSQRRYKLSEQSPADKLFKLLEQNIDTCPQLNSVTVAQCPSSWPRFLCQLRKRNREAMLCRKTKCIEELGFYQPLHATIIKWLVDAINARTLNVIERPPIREGNAWPMRPSEAGQVYRSCYVCHVTGMEPGCLEHETRNVDCGRERGEGPKIYAGKY